MKINVTGGNLGEREIDKYITYVSEKHAGRQIRQLDLAIDGDFVDLKIHFSDRDFQRVFRSADYLVNDINKMNDAKQQEFDDRLRHSVEENS